MTLFIGRDDGTGTFFPGDVGIQLIQISNNDAGYGEIDNPAEPMGIEVTYNRNDPGIPARRLDDLVNTNFGVDIIIWGVNCNYLLMGYPMSNFGGVALPQGDALNPTTEILTIYDVSDCCGSGYYVYNTNGDCISDPCSVILYHELAHCFHFATGAATSEPLAIADENDLRNQLGLENRDVNNHGGGCGQCPTTCCIIASISTGSAYSREVNFLRKVRDRFLRSTEVGEEFFNHLFYDYYSFSPEICRMMAKDSNLTSLIRDIFVGPFVCMLNVLLAYSDKPFDFEFLGQEYKDNFLKICDSENTDFSALAKCKKVLKDYEINKNEISEVISDFESDDLVTILKRKAASSIFIRWAMLDMMFIFFETYELYASGATPEEYGKFLAQSFESWAPKIPITPIWKNLSTYSFREELKLLDQTILKTPRAKNNFAISLLEYNSRFKGEKYLKVLADEGYITLESGVKK